jgi:uncharacterized damage-inducible protein DinB
MPSLLPELLSSHFDYTRYASMLLVDAARKLTHEELTRDMKVSHISVLGTLTHIYQADRVWLTRFRGSSPPSLAKAGEELTLADLEVQWPALLDEFREYVGSLGEAGAVETFTFRNLAGKEFTMPRWQALLHVVNHGTLHRGQVMAMLRQLGHVPPSTDLVYFYRS